MANLPDLGGGGSLSITGDADLERALGGVQLNGPAQQPPFGPSAMRWLDYWTNTRPMPLPPSSKGGKTMKGLKSGSSKPVGGSTVVPPTTMNQIIGKQQSLEKDRARLVEIARAILGREPTPTDLADLWGWAIEQIDAAEMIGAAVEDPWHWLEQRKVTEEAGRAKDEGPQTVTETQRTLNLTDPVTAEAVIDTTLRNLLGRRATAEEKAQFKSTLRAEEEANPTITTSTSTTTPSEDGMDSTVESSSTTTGGAADPGAMAQSFADEELMGEQKAMLAASYYDVLRGL